MFSRATHKLTITHPIPPTIPPADVLRALHEHTPLLDLQPFVDDYAEQPRTASSPDPFAAPDYVHADLILEPVGPVRTYLAHESVPVVPCLPGAWGRLSIALGAHFQDVADGVRSQGCAPMGVRVDSVHRVLPVESCSEPGSGPGLGDAGGWELCADVGVECAAVLMPFVRRNMENAHRELCRGLVERVSKA